MAIFSNSEWFVKTEHVILKTDFIDAFFSIFDKKRPTNKLGSISFQTYKGQLFRKLHPSLPFKLSPYSYYEAEYEALKLLTFSIEKQGYAMTLYGDWHFCLHLLGG